MKKIRSCTCFKVKSSPAYVINLLAREGVKLSDIEKENNYVSFAVSEADSKKTVNILKGYNREYEITARSGISHFAQEMFRRFAVWISVIVLVCGVCIYSLYSMDVKIYGLNRVNAASVEGVLADNSVKFPIAKKKIDIEKLKKDISDLDGVSLCDIRLRGHLIEINVLEELPKPSVKEIVPDKPLVSVCDGLVTRVVVLSGSAKVKAGDSVKAGATLIEPYYMLGDNQDIKVQVGADGYVYGRVWYTKSYTFNDTIVEVKRTGKSERKVGLRSFFFDIEPKCDYQIFEQENTKSVLRAPLPVLMEQVTYYELAKTERQFDFEREKETILADAYREIEAHLPADAKVERKWYIVKTLDKTTVLDIYYEVEQIISG